MINFLSSTQQVLDGIVPIISGGLLGKLTKAQQDCSSTLKTIQELRRLLEPCTYNQYWIRRVCRRFNRTINDNDVQNIVHVLHQLERISWVVEIKASREAFILLTVQRYNLPYWVDQVRKFDYTNYQQILKMREMLGSVEKKGKKVKRE